MMNTIGPVQTFPSLFLHLSSLSSCFWELFLLCLCLFVLLNAGELVGTHVVNCLLFPSHRALNFKTRLRLQFTLPLPWSDILSRMDNVSFALPLPFPPAFSDNCLPSVVFAQHNRERLEYRNETWICQDNASLLLSVVVLFVFVNVCRCLSTAIFIFVNVATLIPQLSISPSLSSVVFLSSI